MTCDFCNWTNTDCLNISETGQPKWICHGCIVLQQSELETLRKREAALRWALAGFVNAIDEHVNNGGKFPLPNTIQLMAEGHSALQPGADTHYLSPDQIKPLAACLERIRWLVLESPDRPEMVRVNVGLAVSDGLRHIKTLGLP